MVYVITSGDYTYPVSNYLYSHFDIMLKTLGNTLVVKNLILSFLRILTDFPYTIFFQLFYTIFLTV